MDPSWELTIIIDVIGNLMGKHTSHVDWFKGNCWMTSWGKNMKFGGSCRFLSISFDLGRYFIQGSTNISSCRNGVKIHMGSAVPILRWSNHWRDSDKKSREASTRFLESSSSFRSWNTHGITRGITHGSNKNERPCMAASGGRSHRAFLKCGEPSYPRSKLLVI